MFQDVIEGFVLFATLINFFFVFFGITLGVIVGALPGLGSSMTLAIVIPMTFKMQPSTAIIFLLGIYVGAYYGGSISATLINTPGTASAAATVLDGYPLAQKGKGYKALLMGLYSSIFGHLIGVFALILFFPFLSKLALKFTPPDNAMLILFALTIIASVCGESFTKGLISAMLGLWVATVGIDPIMGVRRFTFGFLELDSGVSLLPFLIGIFALSEIFKQAELIIGGQKQQKQPALPQSKNPEDSKLSFKEFLSYKRDLIRSSLIGVFVGILPGIGGATAGFFSYARAKDASNHPETFGKGELAGVCASETANNTVVGSSLIPLLALGIPGSVSAAVLLNAFLIHGLVPGPLLIVEQGPLVYSLFFGLLFSAIALFIVARLGIKMGVQITKLSISKLFPIILVLCVLGTYAINNSSFDLMIMLFFGILGYLLQKYGFVLTPLVIAFILSGRFELSIRQSLLMSGGNAIIFFNRPISLSLFILTILSIIGVIRREIRKKENRILQEVSD